MGRPKQRDLLDLLTKKRLRELAEHFELGVPASWPKAEFVDALASSHTSSYRRILEELTLDELRGICDRYHLARSGSKPEVVARILDEEISEDPDLPLLSRPVASPTPVPAPRAATTSPPMTAPSATGTTASAEQDAAGSTGGDGNGGDDSDGVNVEIRRRKPRLVWRGMDRREVASFVPTQVVEVVHPGRAVDRGDALAGMDVRAAETRSVSELPPNRLIWTNDNLVALQTLLDERDPLTHDYRYRGKVDLVYIDPPFMVNNDFRADNSIDIDIDPEAGVQAKKEPSLVEILAYKDSWREGLDTFLPMLRARVHLLRELLAPSGSIYIHLDWHAVHYVKVLLDEIFGYECFCTEIVWKRTTPRIDRYRFNPIHEIILGYGKSPNPHFIPQYGPHDPDYVRSHYSRIDEKGRRYRTGDLTANRPGGDTSYEWRGVYPYRGRYWAYSKEKMAEFERAGRLVYTRTGMPEYKRYLDEMPGTPVASVWTDIPPVNPQDFERLGFPTQKPTRLITRLIEACSPPDGLVLDCFVGSGTTAEAAERTGRRWIGIDNSKYAVHLARKRMIHLQGQSRAPDAPLYDYVECEHCKNIELKTRPQASPGAFEVKPFTVENMGVYQRAETWQDFQTERSRYRDEMIRVFGGEPTNASPLLHGIKRGAWVHVGPLDAPVASAQVWAIAREAQRTDKKRVTVLSADFDTLSASDKHQIEEHTGVKATIRIIPASAIDEVRRRIELQDKNPDVPLESMAIPAFYAPLSIVLARSVSGRRVRLDLKRCEVDIESFLASQRPVIPPVSDKMTAAKKKKAKAILEKWQAREKILQEWLAKANTWEKFVDFWAIDWDYGRRVGADGKAIFETQWQSFRIRRSKKNVDPLVFHAEFTYEQPGYHRIAARVTDVFGNDGIATVSVEIK